ncbi:MAG: DUF86 domain-containing protein [bacterium]|nr:DUF86 domain-containing protein [bacterium]
MVKNAKIFLLHILESIDRIEDFTKGISQEKFLRSEMIQDAVVRRLGVIGEAVKNLPPGFKKKYAQTDWKRIAGTRDILIHEYFGIDLKLTYRIIEKDIPKLKEYVLKILRDFV